jgi:hypothetical protein
MRSVEYASHATRPNPNRSGEDDAWLGVNTVWAAQHCRGWLILIGLFAGSANAAQVITDPFLGVRLFHETHTSAEAPWFRPLNIYVAEIDLTAPGLAFTMTPRSAAYPGPIVNGAPCETTRQTTRQFADAIGAQIGINGAFYAAYPSGGWANNVGLTASNGDHYSPWDAFANPPDNKQWFDNYFHDALNISQTNQASFIKMPENVGDGFQTLPSTTLYNTVTGKYRLIANNNVLTNYSDSSLNPLTAIGTTGNNKLLLFAVDGRQSGFSDGMTPLEIANMLKNTYGATNAISLDGGGSTTMVMDLYNDGQSAQVLNSPSDGSERSVGSNLAVFAQPYDSHYGDFSGNGFMDTADYVIWHKSIGGQFAYDSWRSRFGSASGSGAVFSEGAAVPENSLPVWVLVALYAAIGRRYLHGISRPFVR